MKKLWKFSIIIAVILLSILLLFKGPRLAPQTLKLPSQSGYWGITYSKKFASSIGLDWKETYTSILDDLGAKTIRIPIYWDEIEAEENTFNYADYDWLLKEGAKKNARFILVVGRRVPRWPECHSPAWTKNYSASTINEHIKNEVRTTVERYKNNPNIIAWQVENEAFLGSFGECPPLDLNLLQDEVSLVKSIDKRPIVITGSGELSNWTKEATLGNYFGTTLYRVVWSPFFGYIRYPWPAEIYRAKANQAGLHPSETIVAELQAEPWAPNSTLDKLPKEEANKSFSLNDFKANLQYAADTHFGQVWLWGAEWWYMMKIKGDSSYWDLAKQLKW